MNILDGKKLSEQILSELKEKIEKENIDACLAIISVGRNEASKIYIKNKINACNSVGIKVKTYEFDNIGEDELISLINELNNNDEITGIILQSPVPSNIDFKKCCNLIDYKKDVDGFSRENIYRLYMNNEYLVPCTVKGIIELLNHYDINLSGKNVVIVGRSNIVGRPLALYLTNKDATVTLAHSKTNDLASITKNADILISAVGKANIITKDMIKDGSVVIDVGITRMDGKITGDVDFSNVKDKVSFITPTPGGVGPMTVAMLLKNTIIAWERRD